MIRTAMITLRFLAIGILFSGTNLATASEPVWDDSLGWATLESLKPLRAEGSQWFRNSLAEKGPLTVLGKRYQQKQLVRSSTNGEITYSATLGRKITEFRAVLGLKDGGTLGSVIFKVKADDKVVFTSELISHSKGNTQRVEVVFPAANEITLITDPNGDDRQDWSVWIEPQVKTAK